MALLLFKATVLLLAALIAARAIRHGSAGTRHGLWSAAFLGLLLLPFLAPLLPSIAVPVPGMAATPNAEVPVTAFAPPSGRTSHQSITAGRASSATDSPKRTFEILPDEGSVTSTSFELRNALVAMWAIGTGVGLAMLMLSLARVRFLIRDAEPVTDNEWATAAATVANRLGLRRVVRLVTSDAIVTPMAGGILRPTVFLPRAAMGWSSDRRDVVLTHEIAHLAAHDPARHIAARIALSCYWFHPLAWVAASEGAAAREQACDETVLALGTRPSVYARVLLDLADGLKTLPPAAALPIVHRMSLEKRLMAILDEHARPSRKTMAFAPLVAIALVTAGVAAAQPSASTPPAIASTTASRQASQLVTSSERTAASAAVAPAAVVEMQRRDSLGSGCGLDWHRDGVSRSTNTDSLTITHFGERGRERAMAGNAGGLQSCMRAEDVTDGRDAPPSQWLTRSRIVTLSTTRGNTVQRMQIVHDGGERVTWTVDGEERPVDQAAREWMAQLVSYFDAAWELSSLRGQVASLQGDIASIHGDRASLEGDIASLHGDVSSMRGDIASAQGDEASMRGEIASLEGEQSSLEGQIASELGAIASIQGMGLQSSREENNRLVDRIEEHRRNIARLQRQIRDFDVKARIAAVEKRIADYDAGRRVADIEARINAFNLDARVAEIQRRIAALDVENRVKRIETQIRGLDADRRGRDLEARIEQQRRRLEAAVAAVK